MDNFLRINYTTPVPTVEIEHNYDQRIKTTLKVSNDINNKNKPIKVAERGGHIIKGHKSYYIDPYNLPVALNHQGREINPRANLFDMFPELIDSQILKYGICELISKASTESSPAETQLQITLFGGILGEHDKKNFSSLGFFQYTYSPNTNTWYHRFFKPWTKYPI